MNTSTSNPFELAPVVAAPTGASAQALMQRDTGEVQAAMMIARRFPRDQRAAMDRILMSCARSTLADEAVYQYARGGQNISGPSIRLAEELARQWGNITCGVAELSRYGGQSEVLAYAQDNETGFRDEKRFVVRHWRDTKQGGHAISEERDLYEHIANMAARRKRACILAIIPVDVQEAAVKQCELTMNTANGEVTQDRIKAMLEGFAAFGVTPAMIQTKIQRNIESVTPALLAQLRKIYTSIKDGMSSAKDWFEVVNAETGEISAANGAGPVKTATATATEKLRKSAAKEAPAAAPAATPAVAVTPEPTAVLDASMALLRAAKTQDELKGAWKGVRGKYLELDVDVPLPVEAFYQERKEALAQAADL